MTLDYTTLMFVIALVLLLCVLFYRLGLSGKALPIGKNSYLLIALVFIGLGGYFSYEKYGQLFGWTNSEYFDFTNEELESMMQMDTNQVTAFLLLKGVEAYESSKEDLLIVFPIGKIDPETNIGDTFFGFPKKQYNDNFYYWTTENPNIYRRLINLYDSYKIPGQANIYRITQNAFMIDQGYNRRLKQYIFLITENEKNNIDIEEVL